MEENIHLMHFSIRTQGFQIKDFTTKVSLASKCNSSLQDDFVKLC